MQKSCQISTSYRFHRLVALGTAVSLRAFATVVVSTIFANPAFRTGLRIAQIHLEQGECLLARKQIASELLIVNGSFSLGSGQQTRPNRPFQSLFPSASTARDGLVPFAGKER